MEFYSPHNSLYTVIQFDHDFADIGGHWASESIKQLANKLIIHGQSSEQFAPDKQVTRAEFAKMLVNALGIEELSGASSFSDVVSIAWYSEAVEAAYMSGLITGYEDGLFRPNANITREQMAAMIVRAMSFAGNQPRLSQSALQTFADAEEVADWAKESLSMLVEAQIIMGITDFRLAPREFVTRAQSAVALERMLQDLQFINMEQ